MPSRRKGRSPGWYRRRSRQDAHDLETRIGQEQPTSLLRCRVCERVGLPDIKQNGPHREAMCSSCGAYIKFLSKSG